LQLVLYYFNHLNLFNNFINNSLFIYLVSTLKRRPSPSTSSLSSNSSCDPRGGAIQLTKFGMLIIYFNIIRIIFHFPVFYLEIFPGKNKKKERYLYVVIALYLFLSIYIYILFVIIRYSFFFQVHNHRMQLINYFDYRIVVIK
jgi:hypothetical protein